MSSTDYRDNTDHSSPDSREPSPSQLPLSEDHAEANTTFIADDPVLLTAPFTPLTTESTPSFTIYEDPPSQEDVAPDAAQPQPSFNKILPDHLTRPRPLQERPAQASSSNSRPGTPRHSVHLKGSRAAQKRVRFQPYALTPVQFLEQQLEAANARWHTAVYDIRDTDVLREITRQITQLHHQHREALVLQNAPQADPVWLRMAAAWEAYHKN
ncbi:hypothetical protein BGZ73_001219 [Actinomortierella ambigua]|nr:hypothetical protein BGZ73_001219 [Actinomortierella ambigua]